MSDEAKTFLILAGVFGAAILVGMWWTSRTPSPLSSSSSTAAQVLGRANWTLEAQGFV